MSKKELKPLHSRTHPACPLNTEDFTLPVWVRSTHLLKQSLRTTGSLTATTIGYAGDVVIVGGMLVGLGLLCESTDAICHTSNIVEGILEIYTWDDFNGIGSYTFENTSKWRCPNVDHISRVVRENALCNFQHGEILTAFSQLDSLASGQTLKRCLSAEEKREIDLLKARLMREATAH